jgi:signal transduction histidine kinase
MPLEDEKRSLLIIDDDVGFAESLAEILEARGYTVYVVDTAERAVTTLHDPPFGGSPVPVALIDVRLGGSESGVDLIPRLREAQPDLISVLMTAGIDSHTAIEALRRGAYDYFDKSCEPESLFAVLDRCFDRVALKREREAFEVLRLAKGEAEAANRSKSGFLATMSHELRTPLNAIIGFSEMMLREVLGKLGNEQYRTYAAGIHESGTHLLQIINDILDLSKAEAGKLQLQEDVFDVHSMVRSVRQLISARISNRDLSDTITLPDDLPLLRADERKTKQVLLNLLSNAVKFTPPGGHIEISGRFRPETGLTLTVGDTGIGIAPDDLPRVLQPFEQVDSTFSRSHQGTGLGLPLVKAIMELHGGSLALDSAIGTGTRVTVTFPPERVMQDHNVRIARDAA